MKKSLFLLFFFLSLYFLYIQSFSWPFRSDKEDQLTYLSRQECRTLDPALAQDYYSARIIANIYEGLVKFKPGTYETGPCLATDWEVSRDGLHWTFKLRPGVYFQDGSPFNAGAVKFSVDRQLNTKGALNYASLVYGMVESVQVIDNLTVRFDLKFPYAPFLNNLAMPYAAPIVSPAAAQKYNNDLSFHPAGTGPYVLQSWGEGKNLVLTSNQAYWGDKPSVNKITFRVIKEDAARTRQLINGKADAADAAPGDAAALSNQNIKILSLPGADTGYLGFYTDKKPFNNPKIRLAACQAIDQQSLIQKLSGASQNIISANGPLPPGILGYESGLRQPPCNPPQARQALAAAGYPNGLKITIITYVKSRPYNPAGGEKLAQELSKQLAGAGFQVQITAYPWEKFKKALFNQEGDAFLYGWVSNNGDPDDFLYTLFTSGQITSGLNATHYSNQRFDTLLLSAQRTQDPALRARFYEDAQKELLQDMPAYFISHSLYTIAASTAVIDLKTNPGGLFYLNLVKKQARKHG